MINFRYHVVSIVAVFLALAIGIVLGAGELQGTAFDFLKKSADNTANDLHVKLAQNRALQHQVSSAEQYAQATAARVLPGLLDGQRVVFVTAPGAPASVVTGITAALRQAGATVTGQVSLQGKLFDGSTTNQQYLSQLLQELTPSGVRLSHGPPLQQTAQLLSSAILTKGDPASGALVSEAAARTVLQSYVTGHLIATSGEPYVQATLAVLVAPASPPSGKSRVMSQDLVTLAQELSTTGLGTVLASSISGSAAGSAIIALRDNGSAAAHVSSVDDADTPEGQIVSVWALDLEMTKHESGSYGFGAGSTAGAPSPAPTPSPSPSASTTPGTSGKSHAGKTDAAGGKKSPRSHA